MSVAASRISVVNGFVRKHFVHIISLTAVAGFFMPAIIQEEPAYCK